MKKIFLSVFLVFILITYSNGQSNFLIGDDVYPCTDAQKLKLNSDYLSYDGIEVIFAKDGVKAMLILSIKLGGGNPHERIAKSLFIYLDDNNILKCPDSNKYDVVDDVVTTIYYITNEQLTKLKSVNIDKIRFSIKCIDCISSGIEGDYTASNAVSKFSFDKIERTDFPSLIKKLFE